MSSEYHKSKEEGEEPAEPEEAPPTTTSKGSKSKPSKDKGKKAADKDNEPGSLNEPGSHQSVSVIGIALIAMGEDIGAEMAMRTFNHLVSQLFALALTLRRVVLYCEPAFRLLFGGILLSMLKSPPPTHTHTFSPPCPAPLR